MFCSNAFHSTNESSCAGLAMFAFADMSAVVKISTAFGMSLQVPLHMSAVVKISKYVCCGKNTDVTAVVKISTAKHGIALTKPTGAVNDCRRLPTQPSAEALQTRRLHLGGTLSPHTRLTLRPHTRLHLGRSSN